MQTLKRNKETGLLENVEYKFLPDGTINWRAMVPTKFLYVNPSDKNRIEKKYGKPYKDVDVEKDNVNDSDLVILLGGIKYLLKLRGFSKVESTIHTSNLDYASVNCKIEFLPNIETDNQPVVFSENACASPNNTTGFGVNYLVECATNRAFCRAVRNFLNINVVSKEEMSSMILQEESNEKAKESEGFQTELHLKVKSLMLEKDKNIEDLKKKFFGNKPEIFEKITKVEDIPSDYLVSIIEKLKNLKSKV